MSALAGIWHWDGHPVAEMQMATLADHNRTEGPDGSASVAPMENLALQAHMLHFDELSAIERQPYVFARGSVLTWDGRLDNREDLFITLHHDLGDDRTDVALVAAAYQRWGLDCLPKLLGDWSLALWDNARQILALARDYMGNRPLYYRESGNGVAWSSSLDALAACFDLYGQLNERYIASEVAGTPRPPDMTPFESVHTLRAGHVLQASRDHGVRMHRYFTHEPVTLRYRDVQTYGDHLRHLLTESVRVRLRARGRVWAHLSGGWDSSSVVCLADALLKSGRVEASSLQAVSGVTSGSPESDESSFISAVERWCGLSSHPWEHKARPTIEDVVGLRHPSINPPHLDINEPVRQAGDRIVLTGMAGDLIMCRGSLARLASLLDPLLHGRLLEFLKLTFHYSRENRQPFVGTLGHLALQASLPLSWYDSLVRQPVLTMRQQKRGRRAGWPKGLGLTPATLAHSVQPKSSKTLPIDGFPIVKRRMVEAVYRLADGLSPQCDRYPRIWHTHPYLHRPLVTFVLATPPHAFWDPRITRAGMHRALVDVLPREILSRTGKGDPEAVLTRAHRDWIEHVPAARTVLGAAHEWRLVRNGYLEGTAVAHALDRPEIQGSPLAHWIRLEAWMRTMEGLDRRTASQYDMKRGAQFSPGLTERQRLVTP